jgi:hypothetical protein
LLQIWEPDADQVQVLQRQQQLQELEEQLGTDGSRKQKAASRAAKALKKVSSWEREEEEAARQGSGQRSSSDGAYMVKMLPRPSRVRLIEFLFTKCIAICTGTQFGCRVQSIAQCY